MSNLDTYHLVCKHQDSLQRELALAVVEQIFQRGPQEVNDHHIVVALDAEPVHVGDAN